MCVTIQCWSFLMCTWCVSELSKNTIMDTLENTSCKSVIFYIYTTSDMNTVVNRSVEFDWKQRDRNRTVWAIPEEMPLVVQNIFHLPLAWASGLVSYTCQHETTQAICLYILITPPFVVLCAILHWQNIRNNIFNPVSAFLCHVPANKS